MKLIADQINEKSAKHCGDCLRNTLLPYEHEWTIISCRFNLIKRKHELSKIQRKKNFISRIKYVQHKIFCNCVDVYKRYEGKNYD